MTDRHSAYIVTLDADIREDDAESLIAAMGLLRGVIAVDPVPADITEHIAQSRARTQLQTILWKALYEGQT